jgi:hypothetical protein
MQLMHRQPFSHPPTTHAFIGHAALDCITFRIFSFNTSAAFRNTRTSPKNPCNVCDSTLRPSAGAT